MSEWSDQACDRLLADVLRDPIRVAALFVQSGGTYSEMDDVDPWDVERDAMKYAGPYPVVAHPPCDRWCMPLAVVNQTRYGHKVGDDGGCFEFALAAVRRWGGVLEHPAHTAAFRAFGIPKPTLRGWQRVLDGGWICEVAQSSYGQPARKMTWLYAFGVPAPTLVHRHVAPATAIVGHLKRTTSVLPRLSKREASKSPVAFARMLVDLAATATGRDTKAGA